MIKLTNTLFIGKVLLEFDRLASTNQYALNLLSQKERTEGTIIYAHEQYAGRGQINNKWESEAGKNLTFSTLLYPKFLLAKQQFLLNQIVSLSLFETLTKYLSSGLKIKWPNDIYVFNKKIAGILLQNALKGAYIQSTVIGIGLNVNQEKFMSNAPNPTSLILETGQAMKLENILSEFCSILEKYYLQLKANNFHLIQQRYLNNLFRYEENAFFKRQDGSIFKGQIQGLTSIGKLVIKTKQGNEHFAFKEIQYIL